MIVVALDIGGAWISFYNPLLGPQPYDFSFPYLDKVSVMREEAIGPHITGLIGGETPSLKAVLSNPNNDAYRLIGIPMRAPGVVVLDDVEIFRGSVSHVELGIAMRLTIEV